MKTPKWWEEWKNSDNCQWNCRDFQIVLPLELLVNFVKKYLDKCMQEVTSKPLAKKWYLSKNSWEYICEKLGKFSIKNTAISKQNPRKGSDWGIWIDVESPCIYSNYCWDNRPTEIFRLTLLIVPVFNREYRLKFLSN